jgi:hypothetical protein
MKNGLEIIKEYLKENGFDGLQNGGECGCELSDLAPCVDNIIWCTPGYKVLPPDDVDCTFDFYICENRNCKPWED